MKTTMKLIATAVIAFTLTSCFMSNKSDFEKGKKQLIQQGYVDIEDTGYSFFCCDEKDTFSTGFKCKNSKGEVVTGCFCSAMGKGVTIRFQ